MSGIKQISIMDSKVGRKSSQDMPGSGRGRPSRSALIASKRALVSIPRPITSREISRMIKSEIRGQQEVKFYDTAQTLASVTTAWTIFQPLSNPVQGDTDSQRDGDRLQPTSITLHYQFISCQIASQVRVIVFRWKPNNGALAPTVAQLILTAASQQSPLGYYNRDNRDEYSILHDVNHTLGIYIMAAGSTTVCAPPVQVVNRIVLERHPAIQFSGGTTAGTNHIYVMVCSDTSVTPPQFGYVSRMLFTDS